MGGRMLELNGKPVADSVYAALTKQLILWSTKNWPKPHLAVVLIGTDPASEVYVSHKQKICEKLNFVSTLVRLPATTTKADIGAVIIKLNQDPQVDGILLQLPLPKHLDSRELIEMIDPKKDADGLTQASLGALITGQQKVTSCTPAGVMEMLHFYKLDWVGKKVTVIGRSLIVGLPLFHLLLQENATVTLCHSKTKNMEIILAESDLTIVAIGKPAYFKPTDFKKNSVVIDVGIHRTANGLCGDVIETGSTQWLSAKTPVPGGVGPMTIAMLMKNTMTLAELRRLE